MAETLFPFDEMNVLKAQIDAAESDPEGRKKRKSYYIDEVTDLFVMAYVFGTDEVNWELGTNVEPNIDEMRAAIEKRFDGKNYIDRLNEYLESGTAYDINRVIETDTHRIYNAAKFNGAVRGGATTKTWNTMLDPKVRVTHDPLEGVTIPIDSEFVAVTGDRAMYPSGFGVPSLDINCRCYLTFSK